MAQPDPPARAAEPEDVIAQTVRAVEPALSAEAVRAALVATIKHQPARARLAALLEAQPDLLTSGRPEGPHAVERLIRALRALGAERLALPRCALCGATRPLTGNDGPRRICASCAARRTAAANPCAICGSTTFLGRDRQGRPRCKSHPPDDGADPLAQLADRIASVATGLTRDQIIQVVRAVEARVQGQRKLLWAVQDVPGLLTGHGARGPRKALALIGALIQAGASGLVMPPCPRCGREAELSHIRDGLRCCARCWDAARARPCVRCGNTRPAHGRTDAGEPLCGSCRELQPLAKHPCSRCGRLGVITVRPGGLALCGPCYRSNVATCATCGRHGPCRYARTPAPLCARCYRRARRREVCDGCGAERVVEYRGTLGEALCGECGRKKATCAVCARSRPIHGRTALGEPLCAACWITHPGRRRPCVRCGTLQLPYRAGRCMGCTARADLCEALTGTDGRMRPELEPVYRALARAKPQPLMRWVHRIPARRAIFTALAEGTGPVTHEVLDRLGAGPVVGDLRAVLIAGGALPARDERLARLERWMASTLAGVGDAGERTILRRYASWHYLRRLRAGRGPISEGQFYWVRMELTTILEFLACLHGHGTDLACAAQDHLDAWLADGPQRRRRIRPFLVWTARRGHSAPLNVPHRVTDIAPRVVSARERHAALRRLLRDETLAASDRAAGLLVLLFAQPPSRIVRLTTGDVHSHDGTLTLRLGPTPAQLPEPLAELVGRLIEQRTGRRSVAAPIEEPGWLFPGGRPGQPMTPGRLTTRLRAVGVPVRAARNTALIDIAAELPTKVTSRLLGLHQHTADKWQREAGALGADYAADLARRTSLGSR